MTALTPLSNSETAAFCSQMAMVLKAGLSSSEGIAIMMDDSVNKDEKELLSAIYDSLMQTGSLYISLDNVHVFPAYMLSMIHIGEQTGRIDEVMASLSNYYNKEASLAQTIKTAIAYPCLIILMMLAVILVLITRVMPVFNQVFQQLGTEMTGFSRWILVAGTFLSDHAVILIVILVLLIVCAVYLIRNGKAHGFLSALASHLSGTRALSEQIAAYRFANGMSLTLSSGLPPEECMELTSALIPEGAFHEKLAACKQKIAKGEDLYDSLLSCGIFSGIYTRMAAIAARTGMMDEIMKKISDHYEEEIDARIARLLAAVEPTLVIILSVIVGIILLAVMLPLIKIMSTL
jgi:type IV pilus assembly protein PilC